MKALKSLALALLMMISAFSFVGCKETELPLNLSAYCQSDVAYQLNGSKDSANLKLSDVENDTCPLNNYTVIQIKTKRAWSYGLTLKKITFDIILSEPQSVDIDLTISNLKNGENYNETADTHFYSNTLAIAKESTTVTLDINDEFIDKDATFSFEVDKSCYNTSPNLKIAIRNFRMYGEHQETNY